MMHSMNAPTEPLQRFRHLVLARGYGHCECCGTSTPTDPHHRQPRGAGGVHGTAYIAAHRVSNGLAVCRTCHNWIDQNATLARQWGWLVAHPHDPATVPALIYTVNGYGWWLLDNDGGYHFQDPDEAKAQVRSITDSTV